MIFIGVIVFVIVFVLTWVIATPVLIFLNTETDHYGIRQRGTVYMAVHFQPEIYWELRVFGFKVAITGTKRKQDASQMPVKKKKNPSQNKKSKEAWTILMNGVIRSFRLRRFFLDVDTDNVVLNAQLIPVTQMLSRGPVTINVNFQGQVAFIMEAEIRLYNILWTLIKFLTKK